MKDFSKLDELLRSFVDGGTNPGCAVAVMQGDELIYHGEAGYADIGSGKKVDVHSMFSQASTTKLFTYAIMGMLFEEGRFLFSDPLYYYLPEWKDTKKFVVRPNGDIDTVPLEKPITIRDAVAMMCGLPYCMMPSANPSTPTLAAMSKKMEELLQKGPTTIAQEVRAMADVPVMFEPGSHWLYGFGSEITGVLVEAFENKPLREVFVDRLIEPLGLKDADTFVRPSNKDRVVTNYAKKGPGQFEKTGDFLNLDPDSVPAGARPNLFISAADFAVFMQMLANGGTYKGKKYLGSGTVAMLHENQLGPEQLADFENDYLAGYGYGLGFRTLLTQKYGHNGHIGNFGWTGGSGIWVEADPVAKFSVAYMHNMRPNEELYHHHRVRAVVNGIML
ncbi:CubicO group peptidase, beta-lactamase class C family [Lachnospiraceae bacterium XBB2008]|nr:CubicO group peptidase, beta-lactamase class C family [Lachnospiraceae bacterium XBB2008]